MSCRICEEYETTPDFFVSLGRSGKAVPRLKQLGPSFLAPCRDPARGCPKGCPENPNSLTPENELCWEHFRECDAVGRFPDDPVVARNAAVIREVLRECEADRTKEFREKVSKYLEVIT